MKRREALTLTASLLGGTIIGSGLFLSGCKAPSKENRFLIGEADLPLLDEIGESILPATAESPGAKAAQVGSFIQKMVNDCYGTGEAALLLDGLEQIDQKARSGYGKRFLGLDPEQRLEVLTPLDQLAREARGIGQPHFFGMLKELTLWGYFSSEVGATMALRYNPVPGRYEGCVPYNGENAWAL